MVTELAARALVLSGSLAILASSLLGLGMLVPMQRRGRSFPPALRAAHLDWILLGLMEGLAAALVLLFRLEPPLWAVAALIGGAWANPLPYVFRAFGVDAFRFAGPPLQRLAAALGLLSSLAIIAGWGALLWLAIA